MEIRQATPADCPAIAAIWAPVIRNSDMTFNSVEKTAEMIAEDIAKKVATDLPFLVAEAERQILGFATYSQFRPSVGYRHTAENTIILAATAQGRGLGRHLMAALETHARKGGFHVMIAGISGTNKIAQDFHVALGYSEVGRLPEVGTKFDRWHDLVLMQKRL